MKFLSWPKKHKLLAIPLLLLAFLLLLVLSYFVYDRVATELNKRAFQQAGIAMVEIYNNVAEEVGDPDDSNGSKSCGGFLGVYGEGPISCYLNTNFIYPIKDKQQADQIRERIQTIVKQRELLIPQSSPSSSPNLTQAESASAPVTDYFNTKNGIQCTIDYIFDPTFNSRLELKDSINNKQFYISLSCSGPARAKYF